MFTRKYLVAAVITTALVIIEEPQYNATTRHMPDVSPMSSYDESLFAAPVQHMSSTATCQVTVGPGVYANKAIMRFFVD